MNDTEYNRKLKDSKRGMVFCSVKCSSTKDGSIVDLKCPQCRNKFKLFKWDYNSRMKKSERKQLFCSSTCSKFGRKHSKETIQKISQSQKGISVMT
ncbi:hypothetical protein LCGC14_1195090, partial [marine sediment metagenome]